MVAEADLRQGPAGPGLPGRALVPALRHRPVRPRAGAGLRDGRRPLGLRPLPADLGPARRARPRCWCGRPRRGRWCPTPPWPCTPTSPTSSPPTAPSSWSWPSRCWSRRSARAGRPTGRAFTGARDGALDLPAPLRPGRDPTSAPTTSSTPSTSRPRTAPAWSTSPPRSARTTSRSAAPTACRWSTRSARTAPSSRTSRWSAACSSRRPTRRSSPTSGARGLLFRHVPYEHSYPHCWRCHTALLYYAQPSWYIRTTAVKDALLRGERAHQLVPGPVKHGRYGDWLNNNVDWALSRNRYWGTPLPIWRCAEGHLTCVGSLAELGELTGTRPVEPRPAPPVHRRGHLRLPAAARGTATRVPEVIDAWYDSGSMPFAQWGYPYRNKERLREAATRRSSSPRRSTRPAAGSTR